ncbi:MAG: SIS domain-containing protein [Verrucomicrobiota bacterium]|nr:SIS domain-containing protein [Verrucomicrobiota bacterium]
MSNVSLDQLLAESVEVQKSLSPLLPCVRTLAQKLIESIDNGGKLLTCGNGGSAADSQHMTEELVGRYKANRRPLPAVALTADSQLLTCIANDFGYDEVFSRQIEGLCNKGDMLVCFSTSGNSESIVRAITRGKEKGGFVVALLGKDGGRCKGLADLEIIIPSHTTARIQEAHTFILHAVLELIEEKYV